MSIMQSGATSDAAKRALDFGINVPPTEYPVVVVTHINGLFEEANKVEGDMYHVSRVDYEYGRNARSVRSCTGSKLELMKLRVRAQVLKQRINITRESVVGSRSIHKQELLVMLDLCMAPVDAVLAVHF